MGADLAPDNILAGGWLFSQVFNLGGLGVHPPPSRGRGGVRSLFQSSVVAIIDHRSLGSDPLTFGDESHGFSRGVLLFVLSEVR